MVADLLIVAVPGGAGLLAVHRHDVRVDIERAAAQALRTVAAAARRAAPRVQMAFGAFEEAPAQHAAVVRARQRRQQPRERGLTGP
jgi:hypothetical protein